MATEIADPDPEGQLRSATECPICYSSYDNIFKTPLKLPCAHTFCMECLCRLSLFIKHLQQFPCPLCRTVAVIPTGGVPKLPPNFDIVAQLPPDMQNLQEVWMEGHKLCWMRNKDSNVHRSSLVTVQLLSNPTDNNAIQEGLVAVRQSLCSTLCRNLWGFGLTIFASGLFLFTVIFLPVYLNFK
ncbi:hypothetical protein XELAEV_18041439mg [Xenopus laevis]|uniref:RING-type domain-containing protein n=1 Tax=Xenopus laevis TaxID=8355 RepID=A0A974C264_XENLA|nr:hypothetical protein XELAEV_18041439mg [Xenopus laevis]